MGIPSPSRIAFRWLTSRTLIRKGDVGTYKGRPYRVLYAGPTKYGERANLEFMDGSKSFWVDLALVQSGGQSRGQGRKVKFRYWSGKTEWMSEEEAEMAEDMGDGTV